MGLAFIHNLLEAIALAVVNVQSAEFHFIAWLNGCGLEVIAAGHSGFLPFGVEFIFPGIVAWSDRDNLASDRSSKAHCFNAV